MLNPVDCGTPATPARKARGVIGRGKMASCCGGMPQTINQIFRDRSSGSSQWGHGEKPCWTHLRFPSLWQLFCIGDFCWLKSETTLAEIGSRVEVVECLCLKPCWEGRVPRASTMVKRATTGSSLTGKAMRLGGRSVLVCMASHRDCIGMMTEFFQIDRISTLANE